MKLNIKKIPTFQPFEFSIKIESAVEAAGLLAAFNASNNSLRESISIVELEENGSRQTLLEEYIRSGYAEKIYQRLKDHVSV